MVQSSQKGQKIYTDLGYYFADRFKSDFKTLEVKSKPAAEGTIINEAGFLPRTSGISSETTAVTFFKSTPFFRSSLRSFLARGSPSVLSRRQSLTLDGSSRLPIP